MGTERHLYAGDVTPASLLASRVHLLINTPWYIVTGTRSFRRWPPDSSAVVGTPATTLQFVVMLMLRANGLSGLYYIVFALATFITTQYRNAAFVEEVERSALSWSPTICVLIWLIEILFFPAPQLTLHFIILQEQCL